MKKLLLILIVNLLIPTFAFAEICGVLDFGTNDGLVWEYRDGAFFDLDNNKISDAAPTKKKIKPLNAPASTVTIEGLSTSRSQNSKVTLKFNLQVSKTKKIQITKKSYSW